MPRQQPFSLQHCSVPQPKTIIHITCVYLVSSQEYYPCVQVLFFPVLLWVPGSIWKSLFYQGIIKWHDAGLPIECHMGVPDKILLKFSDNILSWICICPLPKKLPDLEALYCKRYFNIYLWALKLGQAFLLALFQALFGCLTCPHNGSGERCNFTWGNGSLNCVKNAIHTHKLCCHILK